MNRRQRHPDQRLDLARFSAGSDLPGVAALAGGRGRVRHVQLSSYFQIIDIASDIDRGINDLAIHTDRC
jgi:hypothetical protein